MQNNCSIIKLYYRVLIILFNGSASKHLVLLGNPSTYMCDEGVISLDAIFCKIENDMKCIVGSSRRHM